MIKHYLFDTASEPFYIIHGKSISSKCTLVLICKVEIIILYARYLLLNKHTAFVYSFKILYFVPDCSGTEGDQFDLRNQSVNRIVLKEK